MRALSREAVRALDRRAIEEYGLPSCVLMENAGRTAARVALSLVGDGGSAILCLCGPGNNGGDGLVIARTLVNRGHAARVVFVGPPEALDAASDDVLRNAQLWRGLGGEIELAPDVAAVTALAAELAAAPLVVDALFGTGLTRPLRAPWLELVGVLNESDARVLAVDLPSGLDADTGAVLGAAVRADVTVTFVAAKRGFARGAGPELCGRLVVAEIGIPRPWIEAALDPA